MKDCDFIPLGIINCMQQMGLPTEFLTGFVVHYMHLACYLGASF